MKEASRKPSSPVSPSVIPLRPTQRWSQTLNLNMVDLSYMKAPAEVEREDGLVQDLLRQHVVKNRLSNDFCQGGVGQTQNSVELCCDKGGAGFIHRLSKLLVEDGQITDLEQMISKS